jgi:hypothetical protein
MNSARKKKERKTKIDMALDNRKRTESTGSGMWTDPTVVPN